MRVEASVNLLSPGMTETPLFGKTGMPQEATAGYVVCDIRGKLSIEMVECNSSCITSHVPVVAMATLREETIRIAKAIARFIDYLVRRTKNENENEMNEKRNATK
jgi:hypothetical protein